MAFDTLEARQRDRLLAVGRGASLRLDECPGVDFADMLEPAQEGEVGAFYIERGSAVVRVWTRGDPKDVVDHVYKHAPGGVLLVVVVYPSTRWIRFRAWLRVKLGRRRYDREQKALARARRSG